MNTAHTQSESASGTIMCMDGIRGMQTLPATSVHLIFTSPPYGLGKHFEGYGEDTIPKTVKLVREIALEAERLLVQGGKLILNLPHGIGYMPRFPLEARIECMISDMTCLNSREKVIWFKSRLSRKMLGTVGSARCPLMRAYTESLLIFCKGRALDGGASDMTVDEYYRYTKNLWAIPPEADRRHPAPFPLELARRVIKLYTFPGQPVLDPCVGSGTTALAAQQLNRRYIGFDTAPRYVAMAEARLQKDARCRHVTLRA